MKHSVKISILTLITIGILETSSANAAGVGNNIAVRLVGTDQGYDGDGLFTEFGLTPLGAGCFDLDLVDIKTGNVIGSASDCLSSINEVGDGLALTGTTFFFFPGGTLITQGLTTVQPTTHGSPDFTHITGAIPTADGNDVIYGDGKFRNAEGPVRLSGAVNLSEIGDGIITFDCVFIVDL